MPIPLPPGPIQIAFSGGRTSALMLRKLWDPDRADELRVVFTNTGLEAPETLDFVARVGEHWDIPIDWVEWRPDKPGFALVDHATASRQGEPFKALVRKRRYLPNVVTRFCTVELKIRTAKRFLMSIGWRNWTAAIGIRADEPLRLKDKPTKDRWTNWHPLAELGVTRADVTAFWQAQNFDLDLPMIDGATPHGNCVGCFLKSEAFLSRLALEDPEHFALWEEMETEARGWTNGRAAHFSKRASRAEIRDFAERQGELAFQPGLLCQATDGECAA